MDDGIDAGTKLEIYKLVLNRYKDLISEKESHSISEIRQRVSPYNDFIRSLRARLLEGLEPYDPSAQLMTAAERAMDHVRRIRTCEFAFTFWLDFHEMASLGIGTAMDKAILLAALLRSLEAPEPRVLVTRKGKALVRFLHAGRQYVFVPESGSLLMGDDAMKLFADDPVAYSFSDLVYENYEEQ